MSIKNTENIVKNMALAALNLSENEKAVLTVLEKQKLARNVTKIAIDAGIPRTTAIYILKKLHKWKLSRKVTCGRRIHWMYNRAIDFAGKKPK